MLSTEVIAHLDAICDANTSRATGECTQRLLRIKQEAGARGVLGSSRTVLLLDQEASNCFDEFAPKVLDAILDAHAAPRGSNALDTSRLLSEFLEQKLRSLGAELSGLLEQFAGPIRKGLISDTSAKQTPAAIERSVRELTGRLAIATSKPITAPGQVVNSMTINGPVGVLQSGHTNQANVTQSVVINQTAMDAVAAIEELQAAILADQNLSADERDDLNGQLTELANEAKREQPNRRRVSRVIGTVRDALEGLAAAPAALETLKKVATWGASIGATISVPPFMG